MCEGDHSLALGSNDSDVGFDVGEKGVGHDLQDGVGRRKGNEGEIIHNVSMGICVVSMGIYMCSYDVMMTVNVVW